jgi:hypothetical protein
VPVEDTMLFPLLRGIPMCLSPPQGSPLARYFGFPPQRRSAHCTSAPTRRTERRAGTCHNAPCPGRVMTNSTPSKNRRGFLSRLLEAGVDVRFADLPIIEGAT